MLTMFTAISHHWNIRNFLTHEMMSVLDSDGTTLESLIV